MVYKVNEGRPNVVDLIKSGKIELIINTPLGRASRFDEKAIRRAAVQGGVTCITTLSAAAAAVNGIRAQREQGIRVASLQELHQDQTPVFSAPLPAAREKKGGTSHSPRTTGIPRVAGDHDT
jgi:carbamoyl-phosphate synthase large subunit